MVTEYGNDVPIKPILTPEQLFEGFGVEETLHWLQDKGIEGLARLPDQKHRIPAVTGHGLKYLLQPHEFQAVVLKGEYFIERYGDNPLRELEDFLRHEQQQKLRCK